MKKNIIEIRPTDAATKMKSGDTVIVDVREKEEWDEEHIPDAIHMSRGTIELDIEEKVPDLKALIICHCGGGGRSALAAVYATADCMAGMAETPEMLSNSLAFLQIDLIDPDFHKHALAHSRAMRAELKTLLDEACADGRARRKLERRGDSHLRQSSN
jgi:rhodanese-related sulfurtransferase